MIANSPGCMEVGGYLWRVIQSVIDTTITGEERIYISDCIHQYDKAHPAKKVRFCGHGHERIVEYADVLKAVSFTISKPEIEIHEKVVDRFANLKWFEWGLVKK